MLVDVQDELVDYNADRTKSLSDKYKDVSIVNNFMFQPQPASYHPRSDFIERYIQWVPDEEQPGRRFPLLVVPYSNLSNGGERGANRIVMYFHGNAEDLGDILDRMKKLSKWTEAHVCAVEYPGYGALSGAPSESSIERVARQAISYVCRENPVTHENIVIYGRSIGAAVAVKMVGKYGAQTKFGGLVLQSPFLSIKEYTEVGGLTGFIVSSINTLAGGSRQFESSKHIRDVRVRTLVIHGKRDDVIPCDHGVELYELCGSKDKVLYLDEFGDHDCFDAGMIKLQMLEMVLSCMRTAHKFEMNVLPMCRLTQAGQREVFASCARTSARMRAPSVDKWL